MSQFHLTGFVIDNMNKTDLIQKVVEAEIDNKPVEHVRNAFTALDLKWWRSQRNKGGEKCSKDEA